MICRRWVLLHGTEQAPARHLGRPAEDPGAGSCRLTAALPGGPAEGVGDVGELHHLRPPCKHRNHISPPALPPSNVFCGPCSPEAMRERNSENYNLAESTQSKPTTIITLKSKWWEANGFWLLLGHAQLSVEMQTFKTCIRESSGGVGEV